MIAATEMGLVAHDQTLTADRMASRSTDWTRGLPVLREAGVIHQRQEGTWVPPSSLHDDTVRARPVGHIFNTITNGIRTMPAYGAQIPEGDRWAIVAYVRALQRSQHAAMTDLPADLRAKVH